MATKKQLAALAKARKARAANLAKKKPVKKAAPKRKAPAKKRVTRKSNPSKRVPKTNYVVVVDTVKGRGYLSDFPQSGPKFDTDIKNALVFNGHRFAAHMQNAIFNLGQTRKIRGIKSVDIKLIGIPSSKK